MKGLYASNAVYKWTNNYYKNKQFLLFRVASTISYNIKKKQSVSENVKVWDAYL